MDKIFEKFDYNWLIDTGINLGKGRQGLVRLMLLGGHDYVAVKIMKLSQKKSSTKTTVFVKNQSCGNIWPKIPRKLFLDFMPPKLSI